MRYYEVSNEMSALYFGLDLFCQFDAGAPEFDAVFSVQYTLYRVWGGDAYQILGL
jgi:hypothetical protein